MKPPVEDARRLDMARLARLADAVSLLVLREDYPGIDVVIAIENLRRTAIELFPDSRSLFEMIYVSRFRRLWRQFRCAGDAPF